MQSPLPTSLLDLTFTRASARLQALSLRAHVRTKDQSYSRISVRNAHQAAVRLAPTATAGPPPFPEDVEEGDRSIYSRRRRKRTEISARKGGSLMHPQPKSKLEMRVQALQELVSVKSIELESPALSEDDLLQIYEDLLALPTSEMTSEAPPAEAISQSQRDLLTLNEIEQRLATSDSSTHRPRSLTSMLLARRGVPSSDSPSINGDPVVSTYSPQSIALLAQSYRRIIMGLEQLVSRFEHVRSMVSSEESDQPDNVPLSVLSNADWAALTRVCVQENDLENAELALELMKRSGVTALEEPVNVIMARFAQMGQVERIEQLMSRSLTESPTPLQRDLHIKAHLRSIPSSTFPTSALALLQNYENKSIPAPMRTYTRLVTCLFSVRSSVAHAQAWDLFSHMRYVAHPNPDALLYTHMIRACASSIPAEPERALDLFTEMTVDHSIPPTAGTYAAAILACARSGRREYVAEAFRLAKEMLNAHRDARGRPAFQPDKRLFAALLEGAKRIGDLGRARWILAEMVRAAREGWMGGDEGPVKVTEDIMMHVFHAYASYVPPFRRSDLVITEQHGETATKGTELESQPSSPAGKTVNDFHISSTEGQGASTTFTHIPPQSRGEVIAEARALLQQILEDKRASSTLSSSDPKTSATPSNPPEHDIHPTTGRFDHVELTPRLFNSFLSVYYVHAPIDDAQAVFRGLFDDTGIDTLRIPSTSTQHASNESSTDWLHELGRTGVSRTALSYVEALERCALARPGHERRIAGPWADELWSTWRKLEEGWLARQMGLRQMQVDGQGVNARLVERAYIAKIRVLSNTDRAVQALDLFRAFFKRYPATAARTPPPKPAYRSTRTILASVPTGALAASSSPQLRPLVRLSSATDVRDDTVPPVLFFTDVRVLHQRLVGFAGPRQSSGQKNAQWRKAVAEVTYMCKAYEGAVRMRRDVAMRAEPQDATGEGSDLTTQFSRL